MANKVSDFFISINHLVKPTLESRFHWVLSWRLAILRYTGRKSGKQFSTPIAYFPFDPYIAIALTETDNRSWWRNFREPWPMELYIRGQWRSGYARFLTPGSPEYRNWFEKVLGVAPYLPGIFGVRFKRRQGLTQDQLDLLSSRSGLVLFADAAMDLP